MRMTHVYFGKFPLHGNTLRPFSLLGVSVSIEGGEICGIRVAYQVFSITGLEICVLPCSRRCGQKSHFSHPL